MSALYSVYGSIGYLYNALVPLELVHIIDVLSYGKQTINIILSIPDLQLTSTLHILPVRFIPHPASA